jgi:hypothetical protein
VPNDDDDDDDDDLETSTMRRPTPAMGYRAMKRNCEGGGCCNTSWYAANYSRRRLECFEI